jgi:spore coat polysaccharide biosynthesis protein SpsF
VKIVASIEARMASSRLPGKSMADIEGVPAIERVVRRVQKAELINDLVVATSINNSDDAIAQWCEHNNIPVYRGSEEDVLERVVFAQKSRSSDIVVEITGDCVLVDPQIIDCAISTFLESDWDVVTNCRHPGYPMGMDVQVYGLEALDEVRRSIDDKKVREHVSLYFYEHPERYQIIHMRPPAKWHHPNLRLQVDYEEDLKVVRALYKRLTTLTEKEFGLDDILQCLKENPWIQEINADCQERKPR